MLSYVGTYRGVLRCLGMKGVGGGVFGWIRGCRVLLGRIGMY